MTEQQTKDDINSFKLKRPCKDCPFRKDLSPHLKGWLGKERAEGIAFDTFKTGQSFPCHKTTSLGEHDEREENERSFVYNAQTVNALELQSCRSKQITLAPICK